MRIAYNATDALVLDASRAEHLEINRLLSYNVAGAEHSGAFKSGSWNGRSSFYTFGSDNKGHFPAGFVSLVVRGLRSAGFEPMLVAKPLPEPLGPERPEVDKFGYSDRYDYQPKTVDALVRHGKMIAQVATGGGKSRICRMAYKRIDRPTLFLTTRSILMHQMRKAVVEMGEEVAVLGDGEWGIPYTKADGTEGRRISKFCVGMVQTLAQRLEKKTVETELAALRQRRFTALNKKMESLRADLLKKKTPPHLIAAQVNGLAAREAEKNEITEAEIADIRVKVERHDRIRLGTKDFLTRFELVIAEEAHELSGDSFSRVMAACTGAHYRLALTATPFMKDDEGDNMRLMAACGPVAIRITEAMLIERGILARPYFKWLKLDINLKPTKLTRSTPWQKAYQLGIVENVHRNELFCREVLRGRAHGLNAMMLVQHKAHGHILRDMLTSMGLRAEFIDGDSDQQQRQACLDKLGSGAIDVLIGSTILDVGVDVPSVGMVCLVGGGKAEVALRQRIGRGLREKKGSLPNVALIVDCYDEWNNHLKSHVAERQEVIKTTQGFAENIVRDFDYPALGLKKLA